MARKKVKGFTLTEMLVTMLLFGIFLSIAMPGKQKLITKAKATEAKMVLRDVQTSQKLYFYENSKYTSNLQELDVELPKTASEGGTANYKVEIVEAGGNTFTARATAVQDFDGDGVFDVWEINQDGKARNVTPD